jgi:CubicO group peptidase (beta-lactamase class C family)
MKNKKMTLIFSLLWLNMAVFCQTKGSQIAKIMQTYHDYNMFDGAVLVAENGQVIYKKAFGSANREWQISNATDTKFMLGSVSKSITATLMMLQVQKGLVNLDKTLADYLPEFKGKPAANATVKQLLNHTSGMVNYDIIKDFFPRISRQNFSREDYIKVYMDSALAFPSGTRYAYSSWGYFTLGLIMERVTGKSYADLMKEDIFDKLQMSNSGSYFHKQIVPKRATGYDYALDGFASADFRDQSNTMGTGDLYSTVEDLFKFHLAIQNHTLLNEKWTAEMLAPGMRPVRYGYGWFNQNFRYTPTDSVAANYHLGTTEGFVSFFIRIPETNSCAIILCNSYPTDYGNIIRNLLKALYNLPVDIKQPVHKKMETLIGQVGITKAMAEYAKMKADSANFYIDWVSMYYLVEQLSTLKRFEDARILAENNLAEFPNRDLIWLSMGNAYLALNRKKEAIKTFKMALEKFPNLDEAKNRLKELGEK